MCIYRYRPVWFVAPAGPFCFIRKLDCLVPILLLMPHSLFRKKRGVCISLAHMRIAMGCNVSMCLRSTHAADEWRGPVATAGLKTKHMCTPPPLHRTLSFFFFFLYSIYIYLQDRSSSTMFVEGLTNLGSGCVRLCKHSSLHRHPIKMECSKNFLFN